MFILAVTLQYWEDVVDQLCLLQHHVGVGGGDIDPAGDFHCITNRVDHSRGLRFI